MINKIFSARLSSRIGVISLILVNICLVVYAQDLSTDSTRGMKVKEYAQTLPQRIQRHRLKSAKSKPTDVGHYVSTESDSDTVAQGIDIGLTFWRLRESNDNDEVASKERIAVRKKGQPGQQQVDMTPVRVESNMPFADGDLLRMTLESPLNGYYIYVLNREQYVDGTLSEPYLIFPSQTDVGKTDRIVAGKPLFIPNAIDSFELQRFVNDRTEKVAEVFIFLLTPAPIKELPPLTDSQPRKVAMVEFKHWQQQWGVQRWKFERQGSTGLPITAIEKKASLTNNIVLSDSDQLPQTIYHIASKAGEPLLFQVPVQLRR
ncbi:MAG: hypothetical protein AB1489_26050 [Acidobacteriota bacterium]